MRLDHKLQIYHAFKLQQNARSKEAACGKKRKRLEMAPPQHNAALFSEMTLNNNNNHRALTNGRKTTAAEIEKLKNLFYVFEKFCLDFALHMLKHMTKNHSRT